MSSIPDLPFGLERLPSHLAEDLEQAWQETFEAPPDPPDPEGSIIEQISSTGLELPGRAPRLVAITGLPRSGKDHLAAYLASRYSRVLVLAYSTPIIEEVNRHLAPHRREITVNRKPLPHYRHLLEAWGLARRAEDPTYWIRPLAHKVDVNLANGARLIFLSGARVPSDLEIVRERRGQIWKVVRPDNPYVADHPIEQQADCLPYDLLLLNDAEGDPSVLEQRAEAALCGAQLAGDGAASHAAGS